MTTPFEITDPAVAAAISCCWLVRRGLGVQVVEEAVSERHGHECAWCVYPVPVLLDWIEDFQSDPRSEKEVALFERLAKAEQKRRVMVALHPEEVPV